MGSGLQHHPSPDDPFLQTLFGLVFPTLGVLLSAAFSLSPLPRLVQINKDNDLGGYDPLPPILNLGSGVAWVCYSVMAADPFTFSSGAVAAAISTYALLGALHHANECTRDDGNVIETNH